jgi:hypothetical protein
MSFATLPGICLIIVWSAVIASKAHSAQPDASFIWTESSTSADFLSLTGGSTFCGRVEINSGLLETGRGANLLADVASISITNGALLLSGDGSNRVSDSASITLSRIGPGSGLRLSGNVTEVLGSLNVAASTQIIDLGHGASLLSVAQLKGSKDSKVQIWNYSGRSSGAGTDQMIITAAALEGITLDDVMFFEDEGVTPINRFDQGAAWGTVNLSELVPRGEISSLSYERWSQAFFDIPAAPGTADPNGNGLPNLVEYGLGGDPLSGEIGPSTLPEVSLNDDGRLQLTFQRQLNRTDAILTVQVSDDLTVWTQIAQSVQGAPFVYLRAGTLVETGTGNTRTVTVTDVRDFTRPLHRYMRLQVEILE